MEFYLENIRALALEAIAREPDLTQVSESGSWPALVVNTSLWTPQRVDEVRPGPEQDLPDLSLPLRRFAARKRFEAVVYRIWTGVRCRMQTPEMAVLVDRPRWDSVVDRGGTLERERIRTLHEIGPSPKDVARWEEVEQSLEVVGLEKLEALERERAALEKRTREGCQALLENARLNGLACPSCGTRSHDYKHYPNELMFLICRACGCSFRPEDVKPAC